jgi:hypothetical protein
MIQQHLTQRVSFGLLILACLLFVLSACRTDEDSDAIDPGWEEPAWTPASFDYDMRTEFSNDIDPGNTLPEYPRMQLRRDEWLNLNGVWQIKEQRSDSLPSNQNFTQGILVPFPVESALGGVKEEWDRVWYRRLFTVPETWGESDRVLLNFGAVDFEAEVFVNGQSLGLHEGGYDQFSLDITDALLEPRETHDQELIVRVYDPTNTKTNPVGKQASDPGGIFYTPSTGIWQTVWLEPVSSMHITGLKMTPDIDNSQLELQVNTSGTIENATVDVVVRDGDREVAGLTGQLPDETLLINIPAQRLWSPDAPFLYGLEVTLKEDGDPQDRVESYFGMRKVSVGDVDGYKQLFLNNEPIFQRGVLDQGYWPDGLYTAPTDEALKWDLETVLDLGFNMDRKHVKREPDRWYYWADKLGVLVWQDMVPLPEQYRGKSAYPQWEAEMEETINELYNHPAIILWVLYNEEWGQPNDAGSNKISDKAGALDPSRLINQASGWSDYGGGDILDWHCYPGPCAPGDPQRVNVNGEYGGISYEIDGHLWKPGERFAYPGQVDNADDFLQSYGLKTGQLFGWTQNKGLNAYVYTQLTDVETERNGLVTYDRKVIKAPAEDLTQLNTDPPQITVLAETAVEGPVSWRYSISRPAPEWYEADYDDSDWLVGDSGFGTVGTPNTTVRTNWDNGGIWLRRTFELPDLTPEKIENLYFKLYHDDEMAIFLNGQLVARNDGWVSSYTLTPFSLAAKEALNPGATNLLAVQVTQRGGGQYADVGIALLEE